MRFKRVAAIALFLLLPFKAAFANSFDPNFQTWNKLLQAHVQWLADNKQSRVDYAGFLKDKQTLQGVLDSWSAVTPQEFEQFSKPEQMAFLINAYNGFTIDLILTKYPNLKSIKDLGSLFSSPWKKDFFTLLGKTRNLDWIENSMLRTRYNDPRIHVAINCASIGCPALRNEAWEANTLNAQLNDSMKRFLGDHTRNFYKNGELHVSSIFKWFGEDFEKGNQGFNSIKDVFAKYAEVIGTDAQSIKAIQSKQVPVSFEDYDWSLNNLKH